MSAGPEDPDPKSRGTVQPTAPGALVIFGVLGLVLGWSLRPLALRMGRLEPDVPWLSVGLIFFMAAILFVAAFLTRRSRSEGHRLAPHQAVNRLVLGKACALVGAAIAGGYFGFALSQLGVASSDMADTRLWHAALAGLGGLGVLIGALRLERACRVDPEQS